MKTTNKIQQVLWSKGIFAIPVLLLSLLFTTGCGRAEKEKLTQQNEQLQSQLTQTESTVNDLLQTFNDVEANLNSIKQKEGAISMESGSADINSDRRGKIMNDIQVINTLMEENRNKVAELQKELSKSGLKIANLDKKLKILLAQLDEKEKDLAKLKDDLTAKDFQIAGLNTSVDTLSHKVSVQSSMIQEKNASIGQMDKELNTTYYTEGTYKDLKDNGVIDYNGWTPWTGKKVALNGNLSKDRFTEIDKRETTSIPINAKKAVLVSDHPEGTYEFEKNGEGLIASLEIKDPTEFWSISKYLVLEVK